LKQSLSAARARSALRVLAWWAAALGAAPARAAFLSGDALDTAADWLALFVIFIVPCVVIVLFWIVHVLPEKIAHKRHHPQRDAIQTLCLLSLVFGGLLWPIAWLWAFTKPVGYRVAYGTDKHEDYYHEMAEKHRAGALVAEEIAHLREDLEAMAAKGTLPPKLKALKDELARVKPAAAAERAPRATTTEGKA
jgi:CBS domain containing-hemolysin-like protein